VLHHSAQYTSEDFLRLLESHGIACSMSRRGKCWDNAAMKSFFSPLKIERLSKKYCRARDDSRADVFDYIEGLTIHVDGIPPAAISAQYSLKI
jgi:putative transposase